MQKANGPPSHFTPRKFSTQDSGKHHAGCRPKYRRPGKATLTVAPVRSLLLICQPTHCHSERSGPTFSSRFARAKRSACAERNLSSSFIARAPHHPNSPCKIRLSRNHENSNHVHRAKGRRHQRPRKNRPRHLFEIRPLPLLPRPSLSGSSWRLQSKLLIRALPQMVDQSTIKCTGRYGGKGK